MIKVFLLTSSEAKTVGNQVYEVSLEDTHRSLNRLMSSLGLIADKTLHLQASYACGRLAVTSLQHRWNMSET